MKKKLLTVVISFMLMLSVGFGIVGCVKPGDDPIITPPEVTMYSEEGGVINPVTAKTYEASKTDTRADAYTAYKADGTKIADHKSIANAINAAVKGGINSYVTQKNGDVKMFVNQAGYTANNDQCFWFYENGVSLDSFWCYDDTDTYGSLKGTKMTTATTTGYGTKPTQFHNGYEVLDASGVAHETLDANYWEFSSTLDAAAFAAMAKEHVGMTKLDYTLDLTNVKITPAYTGAGANDVYAFMGFYMWQDYYVVNIGIACDVKTGNWYSYIGSSRDNSASDIVYSTEECIMTSTWNDAGYFVPDANSIDLSIETKKLEDDGGSYWVSDLKFETDGGNIYSRRITDSLVNVFFPNKPLSPDQTYVFVAGLDVRNPISNSPNVENVDYFNGAKFENLTVTKALGYVPTMEELSDVDYGYEIQVERGKNHEMLMAKGGSELVAHSVLNNLLCSSYTKGEGKDIYSFSFAHSNTGPVFSEATAKFQSKLDELGALTVSNVADHIADIYAMEEWYGEDAKGTNSILEDKIRNVLNFAPYLGAKSKLQEAFPLDAAATAFTDDFRSVAALSAYVMKGYKAPAETVDTSGYLHNDYLFMKNTVAKYNALSADMKESVFIYISRTAYEDWAGFVTDLNALYAEADFTDAENLYEVFKIDVSPLVTTKLTPETALAQVFYWGFKVKTDGAWEGEATHIMDADNSWHQSVFIVNCVQALTDRAGFELPAFALDLLDEIKYDEFFNAYDSIFQTVSIGIAIENEEVKDTASLSDEQLAALNKYWGKDYAISGLISWNWNSGAKFETYMSARVAKIVAVAGGGAEALKCHQYFALVDNMLSNCGFTVKPNGWGVTDEKITKVEFTSTLTEDAQAFANKWKKVGPLETYKMGGWWSATEIYGGFIHPTAMKGVPALKTEWEGLTADERTELNEYFGYTVSDCFAAWELLKADLTALSSNDVFNDQTEFDIYEQDYKDGKPGLIKKNADGLLAQIYYWSLFISSKGNVMDVDNTWFPSVYLMQCIRVFEGLGLELPESAELILDGIDYESWSVDYDVLIAIVKVAEAIETDEAVTLADLDEATIALIDELLSEDHTFNSANAPQWGAGQLYESWSKVRIVRIIQHAGGTLKNGETPLLFKDYVGIVETFLNANGYTFAVTSTGFTSVAPTA